MENRRTGASFCRRAWAASVEVGREKLAKKGKPLNGFREVMDLPPDLVAYIGLSMLMEGVASQLEHQMLLQKLGQRIEHMAFDQWLQAKDSDLSRKLWQRSHGPSIPSTNASCQSGR